MQKLFTLGIILLSGTVFSSAYAQDLYGSSSKPAGSAQQSKQVMTNDQFKSKVDNLGKQTKNSISQQVDDKLKTGTQITAPPPPAMPPSDDQTALTTQTPPAAMPPAPVAQQPAAAPGSTLPAASSSQGSKPAGTSSQPYSGFGTGQTNQKSAPSGGSNKSGGSWNVGY